jgi:hypothetical protein
MRPVGLWKPVEQSRAGESGQLVENPRVHRAFLPESVPNWIRIVLIGSAEQGVVSTPQVEQLSHADTIKLAKVSHMVLRRAGSCKAIANSG